MIGHQAIAEQFERVALFGGEERLEEGDIIGVLEKDVITVVPAINRVVYEAIIDGAR